MRRRSWRPRRPTRSSTPPRRSRTGRCASTSSSSKALGLVSQRARAESQAGHRHDRRRGDLGLTGDYDGAVSKKKQAAPRASGRDQMDAALRELWEAIEAGDVLLAEARTGMLLALPRMARATRSEAEDFIVSLISNAARHEPMSEAAAFCRLLMSLGSASVKKMA